MAVDHAHETRISRPPARCITSIITMINAFPTRPWHRLCALQDASQMCNPIVLLMSSQHGPGRDSAADSSLHPTLVVHHLRLNAFIGELKTYRNLRQAKSSWGDTAMAIPSNVCQLRTSPLLSKIGPLHYYKAFMM